MIAISPHIFLHQLSGWTPCLKSSSRPPFHQIHTPLKWTRRGHFIIFSCILRHSAIQPLGWTAATTRLLVSRLGSVQPPFFMQALATAIARTLRDCGLWAWAYIDNFLLAHSDPHFLSHQTHLFLEDLAACGFSVNPRDTLVTPTREICFLRFLLRH